MASSFCVSHQELFTTMSELAAEARKIVKEVSRFSPSSLNSWFPFAQVLCLALLCSTPRFFYQSPLLVQQLQDLADTATSDGQKSANSWLFY